MISRNMTEKGTVMADTMSPAISDAARTFRQRIEDDAAFLETCDGGDPGNPDKPSLWLFGIEPGWSLADQVADAAGDVATAARRDELRRYPLELQMTWPFNVAAFKLLAALADHSPDDWRAFAEQARPFERGSPGYFKGNLFPEPFHKVGAWDAAATEATGFATKAEYRAWLRDRRFAVMQRWLVRCRPKLLLGLGTSFLGDFLQVAGVQGEPEMIRFTINGHGKRMVMASSGIVPLAVVPHLTGGSNGLNSHAAITCAADVIRERIG